MDKTQAIYYFWSQFGLPAYDENSVPTGDDSPDLPYITYSVSLGSVGSAVPLTGSLWYDSYTWRDISAKADEIAAYLGRGGVIIPCDGGAVWLAQGEPFSQHMSDDNKSSVKRIYMNLQAEFLSEY